jgi:hypothetical protein
MFDALKFGIPSAQIQVKGGRPQVIAILGR